MTFGKILSYSHWVRKDREKRTEGVATCFKDDLQMQELDVVLPHLTKVLFFRLVLTDSSGLLLCFMYRPFKQGPSPLDFLTEELDTLLLRCRCSHVMVVGDLNFHLEQEAFNNVLMVHGLVNHVIFPTHEQKESLDPVLSDLPETSILCQPLEPVSSSVHYAVLTQVQLNMVREDTAQRTIWLWDMMDWLSTIRRALQPH